MRIVDNQKERIVDTLDLASRGLGILSLNADKIPDRLQVRTRRARDAGDTSGNIPCLVASPAALLYAVE